MNTRNETPFERYLPMTETAFYMLLALGEERHGYGIMQFVEQLTAGRLQIGAGTIYGTLTKMEKDGLITSVREIERRKTYQRTALGLEILQKEINRLEEMVKAGRQIGGNDERN